MINRGTQMGTQADQSHQATARADPMDPIPLEGTEDPAGHRAAMEVGLRAEDHLVVAHLEVEIRMVMTMTRHTTAKPRKR